MEMTKSTGEKRNNMFREKRKVSSAFALVLMLSVLVLSFTSCSNTLGGDDISSDKVKLQILTTGWVNTPTDSNDIYKKWIDDKYDVDVSITSTSDFANKALIMFASNTPPDIVSFSSTNDFFKLYYQDSLISDWSSYVDQMPNVSSVINNNSETKQIYTKDDKLVTLWALGDAPTWSLKVRTDWLQNLDLSVPTTPDALLDVARAFRNNDPDGNGKKDTYAFTTAGDGNDFNTLGNWVPLMYGRVNVLPYGLYMENGEAQFDVLTGNHKKTLDFIRTVIDEDLIDPQWYVQSWDQKLLAKQGKVGFEWMPGTIVQETETYNGTDGSTIDWWDTIDLPAELDNENAGYMPVDNYAGKLITVSAKAALDSAKMEKICALLNDVFMTPDGTRPEGYDALRWGVGIEDGQTFQEIEGTDALYINTQGVGVKTYRESFPGAWDWGSWFSRTSDGIVQGTTPNITDITKKIVALDKKTADMKTRPQIGSLLQLDAVTLDSLTRLTNQFEYKYVTGATTDYDAFVEQWKSSGGNDIIAEAKKQFLALGITDQ